MGNEIERLREENERLNHELRREHEISIRNLADFDNYRRRVERERAQAAQAGKRELILSLLGVIDDLDQALRRADDDPRSAPAELRAIHDRLMALLGAQGVSALSSCGERFNPARHEAIDSVEIEGADPGTVLGEVRRGWQWGDELLRPAQVRVAERQTPSSQAQTR